VTEDPRSLAGRATPAGTAAYARRFAEAVGPEGYGPLGSTGLTVSRLGFGGYRVDDESPGHRAALEHALASGVNLIDTSTNYTDGGSERLVGRVLQERTGSGALRRDGLVVVSKIGYVQGQNLRLAREREASGRPFPEMVKYMDGCWHCLHPEFLQDQLARSLGRLGIATLDVCLLHNPEYFFSDAKKRGPGPLAPLRDEFYRRLTEAFRFFESQAAAARIGWYGVSSNTSTAPAGEHDATSLTRMLAAAREAGGPAHRFRVLQLPMNLFEAGGVLERNNGPDCRETVLECAAHEGIGVLVNRPLNAMVGSGMLRLADTHVEAVEGTVADRLSVVAELEAEFRSRIAAHIETRPGSPAAADFFRCAEQLGGLVDRVGGLEHWREIEPQVAGQVGYVARALDDGLSGAVAERWRTWRDRYRPELDRLLAGLRSDAAAKSEGRSGAVAAVVDPELPPARRVETLSRKALWAVSSTHGVSTVLVGMRTRAYVDDALPVMRWPRLDPVRPVYEAARALLPARR